jgi:hypothetical protein
MDLLSGVIGFIIGAIFGLGGALYYLKWKMNKQIGMMEQEMDQLMEATQGLSEGFEDIEGSKEQIQGMDDIPDPSEEQDNDQDKKDQDNE